MIGRDDRGGEAQDGGGKVLICLTFFFYRYYLKCFYHLDENDKAAEHSSIWVTIPSKCPSFRRYDKLPLYIREIDRSIRSD